MFLSVYWEKRGRSCVNSETQKQKPLILVPVNVDFPLPFVTDAYLFKNPIVC